MTTSRQLVKVNAGLIAPELDYILVDGSGSMADKWYDTLGAIDGYIATLKSNNIASQGIYHVFNSYELDDVFRNCEIGDWPEQSTDIKRPGGLTPLYDAINLMSRRMAELDPPKATIVIATDGEEMGSRHTTVDQAKAMLDWCRAKGWQVIFLGADFNNTRQAAALGADATNMIGVTKARLKEAGEMIARKRIGYSRTGDDISFTDEEKKDFGGYLGYSPTNS